MFREKLIALRKQRGDTQEELARRLFVSRSLVAKWEQGRAVPANEYLVKIASIYGIAVKDLMDQTELLEAYSKTHHRGRFYKVIAIVLAVILFLTILFVPMFITHEEKSVVIYENCSIVKENETDISDYWGVKVHFEIENADFHAQDRIFRLSYDYFMIDNADGERVDVYFEGVAYYEAYRNFDGTLEEYWNMLQHCSSVIVTYNVTKTVNAYGMVIDETWAWTKIDFYI